ncbi:MAG: hypothetical protein JWM85_899 [Acidimicrobiaceae bacterium]|nr:hypothetical protein [Acidimicrobiaceae bacterium]
MTEASTQFRAELRDTGPGLATLYVMGRVDPESLPAFVAVLDAAIAASPEHLLIEASEADSISSQGFLAIGQCGLALSRLTLRTRLPVARRVLAVLGFEGIVTVDELEEPDRLRPALSWS